MDEFLMSVQLVILIVYAALVTIGYFVLYRRYRNAKNQLKKRRNRYANTYYREQVSGTGSMQK